MTNNMFSVFKHFDKYLLLLLS